MSRPPAASEVSEHRMGRGICGCLVDCSAEDFPRLLNHPEADVVEWRIDRFASRRAREAMDPFFRALSGKPCHPVIATNRPVREMGTFDGPEDRRLEMLAGAAGAGAEWIDIELDAAPGTIAGLRRLGAKVVVSSHVPGGTPSREELRALVETMAGTGADVLKIATLAQCREDNLRVLELIPLARREFQADLIAFCMGPTGKWSRLACLFLGSPWTYAQLPGQAEAAPGQLDTAQVRSVLDIVEEIGGLES
jgi:3-dehydroquinate dehydratase-1